MSDDLVVHKNDERGFQIEWRGILFTVRPNDHHGMAGSIAVKDGNDVRMIEFHGREIDRLFPCAVHETVLPQPPPKKRKQ